MLKNKCLLIKDREKKLCLRFDKTYSWKSPIMKTISLASVVYRITFAIGYSVNYFLKVKVKLVD